MKHFVIIRLNVGLCGFKRFDGVNWLEHRMKLFRAFTAPSLRAQTNQNFTTMFLVDPETPEDVLEEVGKLGVIFKTTHSLKDSVRSSEYFEFLRELKGNEKCVVTSRLDSDDGFAKNYIEHVQKSVDLNTPNEYLIYNHGVVWSEGKFFLKTDIAAPFITMVEHNCLDTVFLIKTHIESLKHRNQQFNGDPMWLMACHDNNLLNKPGELGRELSLEEVNQYFEVDTSWVA